MLMEVLVIYNVDPPSIASNVKTFRTLVDVHISSSAMVKWVNFWNIPTILLPPPLIYPTESNHYLVLPIKKHNRKCSRQYPYAKLWVIIYEEPVNRLPFLVVLKLSIRRKKLSFHPVVLSKFFYYLTNEHCTMQLMRCICKMAVNCKF